MAHEEGQALLAENAALKQLVAGLQEKIEVLSGQLAELEKKQKTPSFVKANQSKREGSAKTRKKRVSRHNQARRREEPTRVETYAVEACVTCDYHLQGESEDYRRQVIELPEPQPVEVIEHRMMKRWCPVCQAWQRPEVKWDEQVVGHGRIGVRLGTLIAYLHQNLRAPVRVIQGYLAMIHQVRLSVGKISELLKRLYRQVRLVIDQLKAEVQQQPVVYGDETGWREAGQNGCVWYLATDGEAAIRYYEYDRRHNRKVITRLLGN